MHSYLQTLIVCSAAAAAVLAAPTVEARAGVARCLPRDDKGSPLLSTSISSDGFVQCSYQAARLCEYFTPGGQFSSGSSVCPDSITPGLKRSNDASTGLVSRSRNHSAGVARCLPRDDKGSPLLSTGISSDGFVQCSYQAARLCEYFTPVSWVARINYMTTDRSQSGQFSPGSSVCPDQSHLPEW
ncbi:hypothetical protein B0H14DRAFT_2638203 [Mycena olivaceomarginata]|nr:hypothetical protein B0H14DRAFT_2638203 [Mycena olivaceomarginata]